MNTMQAVMKMLEGKIVHCGGWYAIIKKDKLLIADSKPKSKQEFVANPLFGGHFVKETNNKEWEVFDPWVLKLGDLKPGDKFKFVGDKVHDSHLTYMVIEGEGGYEFFCLNTYKKPVSTFSIMKHYEVEKVA